MKKRELAERILRFANTVDQCLKALVPDDLRYRVFRLVFADVMVNEPTARVPAHGPCPVDYTSLTPDGFSKRGRMLMDRINPASPTHVQDVINAFYFIRDCYVTAPHLLDRRLTNATVQKTIEFSSDCNLSDKFRESGEFRECMEICRYTLAGTCWQCWCKCSRVLGKQWHLCHRHLVQAFRD
jgi:hypothetical protein